MNQKNTSFDRFRYLRPYKPYVPKDNVAQEITQLAASLNIPAQRLSIEQKFDLLNTCFQNFSHSVPNSQIHEIHTLGI